MQAIFIMRHHGFNSKINVGEIISYKNNKYVITHIVEIKPVFFDSETIEVKGVVQLIGSEPRTQKYEATSLFVRKYPKGKATKANPLYRVGDIFVFEGVCGEITNITSIDHEFVDLVITYQSRLFAPWSKQEMDQAISEYRLSTFKVLGK